MSLEKASPQKPVEREQVTSAQPQPERLVSLQSSDPIAIDPSPTPYGQVPAVLGAEPSRWRRGVISAISLISLLLAVTCVWQALPRSSPAVASSSASQQQFESKRIADIRVLDWVLAGNPQEEADLEFGDEIDPSQWRVLTLSAPKKSGGSADVVMARPLTWLYEQSLEESLPADSVVDSEPIPELLDVEELTGDGQLELPDPIDAAKLAAFNPQSLVGRTIYVSVPECGIDGNATVLGVADCPQLKPRLGPEYQLVTATFHHRNAKLLDLKIEGESSAIGTTPNHPFWSEDRQDFVRADELRIGERLRGQNETFPKVVSSAVRPGTHDVYNLEVHLDHTYHVAANGILVHNGSMWACYQQAVVDSWGARANVAFKGIGGRSRLADGFRKAENIAVEAKWIGNWKESAYNPANIHSGTFYARKQWGLVLQMKDYAKRFKGGVIYVTNNKDMAKHLRGIAKEAGLADRVKVFTDTFNRRF